MSLPRVVAADRASLYAPNFPQISRRRLLDTALGTRDRHAESSGHRQVLLLVGEGGMGKSVLLGQLLDAIEADAAHGEKPAGAALLVSCADAVGQKISTADEANDVLGRAAGPVVRESGGLIESLHRLKAEYHSVTLLIDTLDLLVSDESVAALSALVAEALDVGEVVATCRTHEFTSFFNDVRHSAPRLTNRITTEHLRPLDPEEIVVWATRYLEHRKAAGTGDSEGFIRTLRGGVERNGSLRQVCSVPVRLAITCETFAADGHVPEDLTVTGLYDEYWAARVLRDFGRAGTARGAAKEEAAYQVASHVVTDSGTIALHVPKGRFAASDALGLRLLASEGVLRDTGTAWEFFHQTFAEYAHARWLLRQGVDCPHIDQLAAGLRAGKTNLWPAASSLLLQARAYQDYVALSERLPSDGPEGARAQVLAALRRDEPEALELRLPALADWPGIMPAVLPALGDAPAQHIPAAFEAAITSIRNHPGELAHPARSTLAFLLPRVPPQSVAQRLEEALDALIGVQAEGEPAPFAPDAFDQLSLGLLTAFKDRVPTGELLTVMRDRYARLGRLGRREVLRAHVRGAPTEDETAKLADEALRIPCPPLDDDELISLMELFWNCPQVRQDRNWPAWQGLLADRLPKSWNNAQMKFVARLAEQDEDIRGELVDSLMAGHAVGSPELHVTVFELLTAARPAWVAERLLSLPALTTPLAAGAVHHSASRFTSGVGSETCLRLIQLLDSARELSPQVVWPGKIILAGGSVTTQRTIYDELLAAGESRDVHDRAFDAWLFQTPEPVLAGLTDTFRETLRGTTSDVLNTRAQLEGRLAGRSPEAREWIRREVLNGDSPRVAGTAVKNFARSVETIPVEITAELVAWLSGLLAGPHTDATKRLAELLADQELVTDEALRPHVDGLAQVLLPRMTTAVERSEDSNLSRRLLNLLVRADGIVPLGPEQARAAFGLIRRRLTGDDPSGSGRRQDDYSGALRDLAIVSGTLLARRIPATEVRALLAPVLVALDQGKLGAKAYLVIASLLVGIGRRDPAALDWMEEVFDARDTPLGVQLAVAEAFLRLGEDYPGSRAARLKERPTCPQEVAILILPRLIP